MPTAYAYARFSSEKQKHSASLDRQVEAAARYAHSHSLGALGAFIKAVDAKRIAKGS